MTLYLGRKTQRKTTHARKLFIFCVYLSVMNLIKLKFSEEEVEVLRLEEKRVPFNV